MKISLYSSMLFIILTWKYCHSLKIDRSKEAIAEVQETLRKTILERKTGIHLLKSLVIWSDKKKFNVCKLSTNQAFYLCHLILENPKYGLGVGTGKRTETCEERRIQFNDIQDLEELQKSQKLKMYSCPSTSDGHSYFLAPVDADIPTLAVLRSNLSQNWVDAKVTGIDLQALADINDLDYEQVKEKLRKEWEENKKAASGTRTGNLRKGIYGP